MYSSIRPLLEFAARHIPPPSLPRTPVFVMATAGMRLLPERQRSDILTAIRDGLKKDHSQGFFLFDDERQVGTITGEEEGLYAWLALNYLLHRFGDLKGPYPTGGLDPHSYRVLPAQELHPYYTKRSPVLNGDRRDILPPLFPETVGLVELGGGSSQIAFEAPLHDFQGQALAHPPDFVFHVNLDLTSCDGGSVEQMTYDERVEWRKKTDALKKATRPWRYSVSDSPQGQASSSGSSTSHSQTQGLGGGGGGAAYVDALNSENALPSHENSQKDDVRFESYPIADRNRRQPKALPPLLKGGHMYDVYSASFLGYGINSARQRYVRQLLFQASEQNVSVLHDPCLLNGQKQLVSEKDFWGNDDTEYSKDRPPPINVSEHAILLIGTGDWKLCREQLQPLIEKKPCTSKITPADSCPFGGMYQPPLTKDVLSRQIFAFSEFWYSTTDIFNLRPSEFSGEALENRGVELCTGSHATSEIFEKKYAKNTSWRNTPARVKQICFKTAWIDVLLFTGHQLPRTQQIPSFPQKNSPFAVNLVMPASSVHGTEVQWPLGAVLLKMTKKLKQNDGLCSLLAREDGLEHIRRRVELEPEQHGMVLSRAVRQAILLSEVRLEGELAGWTSTRILAVVFCAAVIGGFIFFFMYQSESSDFPHAIDFITKPSSDYSSHSSHDSPFLSNFTNTSVPMHNDIPLKKSR